MRCYDNILYARPFIFAHVLSQQVVSCVGRWSDKSMLWLLGKAVLSLADSDPKGEDNVGGAGNLVLFVVVIVLFHILACVSFIATQS